MLRFESSGCKQLAVDAEAVDAAETRVVVLESGLPEGVVAALAVVA
jgi:hypothetical protein